MFENRVLRRIFGPKRDEVTGKWRKLHKGKLIDLFFSPNIIRMIKTRKMRWAGHVERMAGEERCIQDFGGEREGKRPLGKPRHSWEDNIKTDLKKWYGSMD